MYKVKNRFSNAMASCCSAGYMFVLVMVLPYMVICALLSRRTTQCDNHSDGT